LFIIGNLTVPSSRELSKIILYLFHKKISLKMESSSRIDHMKHGVIMGSALGVCLGLAFGTYHVLK
jgi:hypothetical protein